MRLSCAPLIAFFIFLAAPAHADGLGACIRDSFRDWKTEVRTELARDAEAWNTFYLLRNQTPPKYPTIANGFLTVLPPPEYRWAPPLLKTALQAVRRARSVEVSGQTYVITPFSGVDDNLVKRPVAAVTDPVFGLPKEPTFILRTVAGFLTAGSGLALVSQIPPIHRKIDRIEEQQRLRKEVEEHPEELRELLRFDGRYAGIRERIERRELSEEDALYDAALMKEQLEDYYKLAPDVKWETLSKQPLGQSLLFRDLKADADAGNAYPLPGAGAIAGPGYHGHLTQDEMDARYANRVDLLRRYRIIESLTTGQPPESQLRGNAAYAALMTEMENDDFTKTVLAAKLDPRRARELLGKDAYRQSKFIDFQIAHIVPLAKNPDGTWSQHPLSPADDRCFLLKFYSLGTCVNNSK